MLCAGQRPLQAILLPVLPSSRPLSLEGCLHTKLIQCLDSGRVYSFQDLAAQEEL